MRMFNIEMTAKEKQHKEIIAQASHHDIKVSSLKIIQINDRALKIDSKEHFDQM